MTPLDCTFRLPLCRNPTLLPFPYFGLFVAALFTFDISPNHRVHASVNVDALTDSETVNSVIYLGIRTSLWPFLVSGIAALTTMMS